MLMFNNAFGIASAMLAQVVLHGTWLVLVGAHHLCYAKKVLHWRNMGWVER